MPHGAPGIKGARTARHRRLAAVRLTFRHRLFLGLVALGTVPLAAAMVALALYVRSTASLAGPRAAVDSITASGRAVVAALDTASLHDSTRALVQRHAEQMAIGARLTRRAESLSRWDAALVAALVLFAAALLVALSVLFVRNWSAQVSAPVEDLVDWTRRIQRGEPLPPGRGGRDAAISGRPSPQPWPRTASVCSPSCGAGRAPSQGEALSVNGGPGTMNSPSTGCETRRQ